MISVSTYQTLYGCTKCFMAVPSALWLYQALYGCLALLQGRGWHLKTMHLVHYALNSALTTGIYATKRLEEWSHCSPCSYRVALFWESQTFLSVSYVGNGGIISFQTAKINIIEPVANTLPLFVHGDKIHHCSDAISNIHTVDREIFALDNFRAFYFRHLAKWRKIFNGV